MAELTNNRGDDPAEPVVHSGTTISGRALIMGILSAAVLMAGYAWLHQKGKGRRTLAFWGSRAALSLRYGKHIELLRLAPPGESLAGKAETLDVDGQSWEIVNGSEIGSTPGLVHARQALVFDPSYDFDAEPYASPVWQYALRIRNPENESERSSHARNSTDSVVLLFDLEHAVARRLEDPQTVTITIAQGLRTFFEENVP